jgi:RNA polymerase sigma-70 factor (ECF subfamily)
LGDADLARRIAGAERGSVEDEEAELYRRYARRVYHYGLRHLRAEDRAFDLVQEVFVVTIEKLRSGAVREPERIGSFILGVARMVSRSAGRLAAREQTANDIGEFVFEVGPTTSDPIARDHLARCLEALPERHRSIVLLTYFAEQSTGDIATSLGLSGNNVRVIRHRSIAQLRSCLGFVGKVIEA